jgi:hypothetical protein
MTGKIIDYKLLSYASLKKNLSEQVMDYVRKGYQLYGSPCATYDQETMTEMTYQAVVLYEGDAK